jgi:hypothetical protein
MFSYANYPGAFHQETVPLRLALLPMIRIFHGKRAIQQHHHQIKNSL